MFTSQENNVLDTLIHEGCVPTTGIFEVQESQIIRYTNIYHGLFGKTNKSLGGSSNTRMARRLAGRTLLKVNFNRGAKHNDISAGLVYLIENPAFPIHYKVGMTINVHQRLAQYQTYDPYRQFKVAKYDFVLDRRTKEKEVLTYPEIYNEQGEWIKRTNALEVFQKLINIPQ